MMTQPPQNNEKEVELELGADRPDRHRRAKKHQLGQYLSWAQFKNLSSWLKVIQQTNADHHEGEQRINSSEPGDDKGPHLVRCEGPFKVELADEKPAEN